MRAAAKSFASFCFFAVAIAGGAADSEVGRIILYALAFCALGDILLLRRHQQWFLAGMGAFALGHVAFAIAFVKAGADLNWAAVAAFALVTGAGGVVLTLMRRQLGLMIAPVSVYSLIIAAMCAAAAGLAAAQTDVRNITIALAAIAFAISDIAVARDQFVRRDLMNRLWGLPLYYAAQLAFAISV